MTVPNRVIATIGKSFGKLTVTAVDRRELRTDGRGYRYFVECSCSCGSNTIVSIDDLLRDKRGARSCGCLRGETNRLLRLKHGQATGSGTREYRAWLHMVRRCNGPASERDAANYRDRGISVCDRWAESFAAFFADMGSCPSPEHSIDRINNDGNYEPGNCRWATIKQQTRNRRSNINVEYQGQVMCLTDFATSLGLRPKIMHKWNSKYGTAKAMQRALAAAGAS